MKKEMTLKRKLLIICLCMVLFPILLLFLTFFMLKASLTNSTSLEMSMVFANPHVMKKIVTDMMFVIILILVLMAFFMRKFILNELIAPINDLNIGMRHIKDGNFDYQLPENTQVRLEPASKIMNRCVCV